MQNAIQLVGILAHLRLKLPDVVNMRSNQCVQAEELVAGLVKVPEHECNSLSIRSNEFLATWFVSVLTV